MNFLLNTSLVLAGISGSRGYGMNTSESDTDVVGICVPPKPYWLGYAFNFEQSYEPLASVCNEADFNSERKIEYTTYGIRKFFALCAQCNPNIIEIAWMPDENVRYEHPIGAQIRANRNLFLSTKVRYTFCGYAYSQLKRIQTHRRWLLDPKQTQPLRSDFGLRDTQNPKIKEAEARIRTQISQWQLHDLELEKAARMALEDKLSDMLAHDFPWTKRGNYEPTSFQAMVDECGEQARIRAIKKIGFDDNLMELIQKEHEFTKALQDFRNYQTWKTQRNPARAALEAKSGYDTKHASHLVRLMRMAEEILTGQGVLVKRPDARELLAIRGGALSYEALMTWVEAQEAKIAGLYDNNQYLPKKVDVNALDELCIKLVEEFLNELTKTENTSCIKLVEEALWHK